MPRNGSVSDRSAVYVLSVWKKWAEAGSPANFFYTGACRNYSFLHENGCVSVFLKRI